MTKTRKTMSEVRRMIDDARAAGGARAIGSADTAPVLSTHEVHQSLQAQVGQLDLGPIGNLRARLHQRSQDGRMQRKLTAARAEHATALMIEKLQGEVQIIRTHFKADFADRIAALAESAAASQIMVMRKLKAIEAEARNFVMYDLQAEMDELHNMLETGVIDQEGFCQEASFRIQRYEELKGRVSQLLDGYQATVQGTYQGASS